MEVCVLIKATVQTHMHQSVSSALSLIPGCRGDGSPAQSLPGSSTGISDHFGSGSLAWLCAGPGSVGPDASSVVYCQ